MGNSKSGAGSPAARDPARADIQSGRNGSTMNAGIGICAAIAPNASGGRSMAQYKPAVSSPYRPTNTPATMPIRFSSIGLFYTLIRENKFHQETMVWRAGAIPYTRRVLTPKHSVADFAEGIDRGGSDGSARRPIKIKLDKAKNDPGIKSVNTELDRLRGEVSALRIYVAGFRKRIESLQQNRLVPSEIDR